jgi:hypothetical protein
MPPSKSNRADSSIPPRGPRDDTGPGKPPHDTSPGSDYYKLTGPISEADCTKNAKKASQMTASLRDDQGNRPPAP